MAKGITDSTVEEIKARIDLADLIASYGIQVKTAGASKKACCPFHHEKTPSFNINDNKGYYHCFGCGESGDAIKFVQKMDGLTFVEAVKKLAEQCGVKIEEKEDPTAGKRKRLLALMAELAQFYHRCLLQTKEAEPARAYLKSRDLGPDVQESFLIGYAPNGISNILRWAEKYKYTPEELAEAGVIKPPRDATARSFYSGTATDDYLRITLTDEQDIPDAVGKLRSIYPNLMKLDYDNARTRAAGNLTECEAVERRSPIELFAEFYEKQNNRPMDELQRSFSEQRMKTIWEAEE